jgi:photosystem II stability/assembly factor-like uncharacterized protein
MTRLVAMTRARIALALLAFAAPFLHAQAPDAATLASLKWRSIGPVNMAGRITDVEVNPKNTKEFYVTGAAGGVWKSVNAGTTFFSVWEKEAIASIGDLAIAPSNPQILYVGTGEQNSRNSVAPGYGVYKSTNGGVSWESVGLEKTQHIGRIVVHPTNPNVVYVAALGALWGSNAERGVYKTTDGGKNWTLVKFVSDKAGFVDLAMDPRNPEVLWAASYERVRKPAFLKSGGPGSALWRTTDGGRTWSEIKGGGFPETQKGRMNVVLAPSNPNIVYVMVEADSVRGKKPQQLLSGVYRSADAGKTWKWMSTINNRPFYFSQIRVDPRNPNRIYRMAVDFAFSDDGGYSWRTSMLGIHEDYHAMWINPADPEHFIIGGDAGVFQTWDRGGTYDAINNMPMGQFYGVSYDFQVPYRVCGGLQDNGTSCGPSRRRNGQLQMTDWYQVASADGLMTAQDWADPNNIYYTTQGGNISRRNLATGENQSARARTVNVGQLIAQIAQIKGDGSTPLTADQQRQIADLSARIKRESADPAAAARYNWNSPFIVSAHNANVLYTGADKLFKSIEKGANPRAISPDLTRADPMWIRVSGGFDADGNAAADASGGITRDATGAEENSTIVTIGESTIRAGLLYTGSDDGKVFLTRNDGATWEDLSNNMPGVPAMAHVAKVEPSHHDSATVYVVRDNHRENDFKPYVFVSTDWGKTFRSINGNLPNGSGVPASTYVIREDPVNPNLLYVGTETGVFASLDKGQNWFSLGANLPTVPVYDLQVHPRDRELIAGTHGRAIWIIDVSQLQQMTPAVLAKGAHLFVPPPAFQYVQPLQGSEPRGQRGWRGEGGPSGAEISYRLAAATPTAPRVLVLNAAGDTISRLTGTGLAGINKVTWNFIAAPDQVVATELAGFGGRGGGRGGRGGFPDTAQMPGFPRGYNARPAEAYGAADTSGSPTAVQRTLAAAAGRGGAGQGGRGGGGGGGRGGRGNISTAETGDYRVVLDVAGQKQSAVLRVVRVQAGEPMVMAPRGGR